MNSDYVINGSGAFCTTAKLSAAISYLDDTLYIKNFKNELSSLPQAGDGIMVENEMMVVVAYVNGKVTVGRGSGDTVPQEHAADSTVWFFKQGVGSNEVVYVEGESIGVKPLPKTASKPALDIALVPARALTFASRFFRPYPPANVQANSIPWYDDSNNVTSSTALLVSWNHRDRVVQADQLVDHMAASVGPEVGTTYTVRIYDADDVLLHAYTGITGTSFTYTVSDAVADSGVTSDSSGVPLKLTLHSVRDGVESLQGYTCNFTFDIVFNGQLDTLSTNLWACFGLNRQLTSYGGPAIRVRRSSDNAEMDVDYLGAGSLNVASMLTWCGSDSVFVTKFYDNTANARHLQQATTTKQARIVNAGVYDGFLRFDGSDDEYNFTVAMPASSVFSISLKYMLRALGGQQIMTQANGNTAGHVAFTIQLQASPDTVHMYEFGSVNPNYLQNRFPTLPTVVADDLFVMDRTASGVARGKRYVNGAAETATNLVNGGTGNFTSEVFSLGGAAGQMNVYSMAVWTANQDANAAAIHSAIASGHDYFFPNVSLYAKGEGVNGASVITDSSSNNLAVTTNSGVITSTVSGASALLFGTSGVDYLSWTGNAGFLMAGNFTIEGYFQFSSKLSQTIWNLKTTEAAGRAYVFTTATGVMTFNRFGQANQTFNASTTVITPGTRHFIQFIRSGSTITCAIDGVSIGTVTDGTTLGNGVGGLFVAGGYGVGETIRLDRFRVTKGVARPIGVPSADFPTEA